MTLDDALSNFDGNKSALAKALGISKQAINNWSDEKIPERHELKLRHVIVPAINRDVSCTKKIMAER